MFSECKLFAALSPSQESASPSGVLEVGQEFFKADHTALLQYLH